MVAHHDIFLYITDEISGNDVISFFHQRLKLPELIPVKGRHLDAPGDAGAGDGPDRLQRALNAVINRFNHAGAQFHGKGCAGGLHHVPGADAGGFFINLNGGLVAAHLQDLADQLLGANPYHIGHVGIF